MLTRQLGSLAGAAPIVVRVIVGSMMFAHGVDKINGGPTSFGRFLDTELGLPAGVALGWIVTFLELIGGAMLVVGLLSRVVAALLTLELIGAIVLVTWSNGLIGSEGVGFERDLAYISGFLAVLFLGPGRPSLDHALGIETGVLPSSRKPASGSPPIAGWRADVPALPDRARISATTGELARAWIRSCPEALGGAMKTGKEVRPGNPHTPDRR